MATNDVYKKIDELVAELGTAAERRREIEAEISDLTAELAALDQLAEDSSSRTEYVGIIDQRKEAELDLRFSRNRLRLFDQTPRVSREQLKALLDQLNEEADAAATDYREVVARPMSEVIKAGDEFDAAISMVRGAVCKLASVTGPAIERDSNIRRMFADFELGKLRSRAYMDNRLTVHPDLRDALRLASTSKQLPFRV